MKLESFSHKKCFEVINKLLRSIKNSKQKRKIYWKKSKNFRIKCHIQIFSPANFLSQKWIKINKTLLRSITTTKQQCYMIILYPG